MAYIAANVAGRWDCDESSWDGTPGEIYDDSKNRNDGTAQGSATTTGSGKLGRAADLGGGGTDYMQFTKKSYYDFPLEFTIALWLYYNSVASWDGIIGNGGSDGWGLLRDGPGIEFKYAGATPYSKSWSPSISTWYLLIFRRIGNTLDCIINNSSIGTATYSTAMTGANDLFIGKANGFNNSVNGRIDTPIIWQRGLSDTEAGQLWNDGAGWAFPMTPDPSQILARPIRHIQTPGHYPRRDALGPNAIWRPHVFPKYIGYEQVYKQFYRVADDSLDRYELYQGEDQMPDFDASDQPVATSPTLPFSDTPPLPSSGSVIDLYNVVRKRNKYNLLSHNQHPTIIQINDLGEEELGPLSAPEILSVTDEETYEIAVFARYPYGVDRNEADTWELYIKEGVDPDPDVDSPVATESFGAPGADYRWYIQYLSSSLTPGSTYHIMVVVKRSESGDTERGESTVVQHTMAETFDMDAETASLFGGQEFEIGL